MIKVYRNIDPSTGRGLYDDEIEYMGIFQSIADAVGQLGGSFISHFCTIRTA